MEFSLNWLRLISVWVSPVHEWSALPATLNPVEEADRMNAEFLLFRAVTASVVPVARHLKEFGPQQAHPEGRHACQI